MKTSAQFVNWKQTSQTPNIWLLKYKNVHLHTNCIKPPSKPALYGYPAWQKCRASTNLSPNQNWKKRLSLACCCNSQRDRNYVSHCLAPSHPRGRSARPYLISAGSSPARSRLWTASLPPWPAAGTGAHRASHHTPHLHHSQLSPGQCCTRVEPLASFGTLPRDTEEKREVTIAARQEGGGPSAGRVSQESLWGHHLWLRTHRTQCHHI